MKKWLIGCLMMVLLFTTTTAFAGHIKKDGSMCNSEGYTVYAGSENKTETQHKMQCQTCREVMWENHWKAAGDEPTCKKQARCGLCGLKFGPFGEHKFSEATCVARATCTVCQVETGGIDPNNHNLEHHVAKAATCTEKGWEAYDTCTRCSYTTYKEIPALDHDKVQHDAKAATCTEKGWEAYDTCTRCDYTTYKEIPALDHDLVYNEAKDATCTEVGWDAYEACKREGCDYTTRKDIPALNHDIEKHAAKAPTCTEIGWDAYQTCSRCDYTTYQELNALNHDKVHHDAKAATCLEIGWNEYDTCSRCDYTTYAELPALNHNYQNTIVKPTCEADGYTLHTCARCKDTYTDTIVPQRNHWYGEWMPNADSTHSAGCLREGCKHAGKTACQKFDCMVENGRIVFCPVCGNVENGERLELVQKAFATAVTGKLPGGELVARVNQEYLSVAFERAGKLTIPTGKVKVTLPAAVMQGKRLMLIALDGTETELPFEIAGENISFTLDFTEAEIPVMLVRKSL